MKKFRAPTYLREKQQRQERIERFIVAMRTWLTDNVASQDENGNWWGYDTNVGNLLENDRLQPLIEAITK